MFHCKNGGSFVLKSQCFTTKKGVNFGQKSQYFITKKGLFWAKKSVFCCKKGVIFKLENKHGYHFFQWVREPGEKYCIINTLQTMLLGLIMTNLHNLPLNFLILDVVYARLWQCTLYDLINPSFIGGYYDSDRLICLNNSLQTIFVICFSELL